MVILTLTAYNATVLNNQNQYVTSADYPKPSVTGKKMEGWLITVKPDPSASSFTMILSGRGTELLSDAFPDGPRN
jgi:hypothetical protein